MIRGRIRLIWNITRNPDFDGFRFYVEAGDVFDADDYAEAYGLHRRDIDHNDIADVQAAASNMGDDEWLEVTHIEDWD